MIFLDVQVAQNFFKFLKKSREVAQGYERKKSRGLILFKNLLCAYAIFTDHPMQTNFVVDFVEN